MIAGSVVVTHVAVRAARGRRRLDGTKQAAMSRQRQESRNVAKPKKEGKRSRDQSLVIRGQSKTTQYERRKPTVTGERSSAHHLVGMPNGRFPVKYRTQVF